jgi:hypothetical protein
MPLPVAQKIRATIDALLAAPDAPDRGSSIKQVLFSARG